MKTLTSARSIHHTAVIALNGCPSAFTSAPEVFQKKNESLFGDIEGVEVIFDDLIVAAADKKEHDKIMLQLLQRAQEANVKFNSAKLQYKVSEVT